MTYVQSIQDRLLTLAATSTDKAFIERAYDLADQLDKLESRGKTFTGKYERLQGEANDLLTDNQVDD